MPKYKTRTDSSLIGGLHDHDVVIDLPECNRCKQLREELQETRQVLLDLAQLVGRIACEMNSSSTPTLAIAVGQANTIENLRELLSMANKLRE